MPQNAPESARAKIDRAKQHLKQLELELEADWNANRYGPAGRNDPNTREHIITYRMPENLSVRYGILAGEVIGQIRSAFEHIVWGMLPNPVEGKTGFPIIFDKSNYPKKGLPMIDGIKDSAATVIESLQPFNSGGSASNLHILNELWKRDKHRVLNLVGVIFNAFKRIYYLPDGTTRQYLDVCAQGKLKDGAEIARLIHPDFFHPPEVRMVVMMDIFLNFGDAGPATDRGVKELLGTLVKFGEGTVDALIATI